jgi:hypothetical protein
MDMQVDQNLEANPRLQYPFVPAMKITKQNISETEPCLDLVHVPYHVPSQ